MSEKFFRKRHYASGLSCSARGRIMLINLFIPRYEFTLPTVFLFNRRHNMGVIDDNMGVIDG